jgi:hypothetical protein
MIIGAFGDWGSGKTVMWNVLLIFGSLGAITGLFFRFLDEAWISDLKRTEIRQRFENWWFAVAAADTRSLSVALATKTAQATDFYFGHRLFSKRAFLRSFTISTSLLGLLLGLTGIGSGCPIALAPWRSFQETAARLEECWSQANKNTRNHLINN